MGSHIFSLQPFRYTDVLPARHIRLIKIHDIEFNSPIELSLSTYALDYGLPYEALSYTWGDYNDTVPLVCNRSRMLVTRNLYRALERMRIAKVHRNNALLWVDAICINQGAENEKNEQVRMMGEIYSMSSCVRICPGGFDNEVESELFETINLMTNINQDLRQHLEALKCTHRPRLVFFLEAAVKQYCEQSGKPVMLVWINILKVLTADWCNRVWALQETVKSHRVWLHLGQVITKPSIIFRLAWIMDYARGRGIIMAPFARRSSSVPRASFFNGASFMPVRVYYLSEDTKLHRLARQTATFDATNPKDKIFALVGMASDVQSDFVDYGLSVRQILINLANNALNSFNNGNAAGLDFLSNCRSDIDHAPDQDHELPSWAPDFTKSSVGKISTFYPLSDVYPSAKVPGPSHVWDVTFNEGEVSHRVLITMSEPLHRAQSLGLYACILDKVEEIIPNSPYEVALDVAMDPETDEDFAKPLQEWFTSVCALAGSLGGYFTGETIEQALTGTLVFMDIRMVEGDTKHLKNFRRLIALFPHIRATVTEQHMVEDLTPELIKEIVELSSTTSEFLRRFDRYSKARVFCVTEKGLMGWVPKRTKIGDHVAYFHGCRIPFVLRNHLDGYRILGDSYFHGMMCFPSSALLMERSALIKIY